MIERRRVSPSFNYAGLKALAKQLERPISTLLALTPDNDPFYAQVPARLEMAQWFAGLWERYDLVSCSHLRAMHYRLVSQKGNRSVRFPDRPDGPEGPIYKNTHEHWVKLITASRDARHLELVPDTWNDRKATALEFLAEPAAASINVANDDAYNWDLEAQPALPSLTLEWLQEHDPPIIAKQPYHLELWCEKTTMNDILKELGRRYRCNVITGEGEFSLTQCIDLVERAIRSVLPVRILYVSDFDPKGQGMPVSVARKIEHILYRRKLQLDIQVRHVALTHDQCLQYDLPRTPIKDSEKAKGDFEQRYGEGATELDALEAIHPGVLRTILVAEIERYFDPGLAPATQRAAAKLTKQLETITNSVHAEYLDRVNELNTAWAEIAEKIEAWKEQAKTVYRDIRRDLIGRKPDPDAHDWPEARQANEDDDPLFDSTRDYVEQIDRYKEQQDKPTERRG
jgi:hypothetical protein